MTASTAASPEADSPDGVTVRRSPSVAKLCAALVGARATVANPVKNRQNPHLKNWYADLSAVLEAVLPAFTAQGLAVVQLPCELDDDPALMTLLMHTSGEWLETVTKIRPVKNDPQGVGSAQSYARRYALQSLAGVAAEDDDDGNAASARGHQQQKPAAPKPPPAKAESPNGSYADPDPVADGAAYNALARAKGVMWSAAVAWLNAHCGTNYDTTRAYQSVPADYRARLVAELRTMPDAAPREPSQKAG